MKCNHTKGEWVTERVYNDWTGEYEIQREYVEKDTLKDVGLYNCKCTQCGKMLSYGSNGKVYADECNRKNGIE